MKPEVKDAILEGVAAGMRYAWSVPGKALKGAHGDALGRRSGSSLEFRDHRDYQPGDDLRRLDWNVYARTDKLAIKQYMDEVTPHLEIVLDTSASMALPGTEKARAACGLAAMCWTAATNARCSARAWMLGEGVRPVPGGHRHPASWDGLSLDAMEGIDEALKRRRPAWKPLGMRVLISDLLWPGDPYDVLRPLCDGASLAVIVQILAREDLRPPERGNLRLEDIESGEAMELFIDAEAEDRYRSAWRRHREAWSEACARTGARWTEAVAEDLVARWELPELERYGILEAS